MSVSICSNSIRSWLCGDLAATYETFVSPPIHGSRMRPLRPRVTADDESRQEQFFGASDGKALDAILKWIPIEVIAAYQFTIGVVPENKPEFLLPLAVVFTILTGGWIAFATANAESLHRIAWRQVILSTFAFAIWIVGTQPTALKQLVEWWEPFIGSIVLGVGWLLLPILNGLLIQARVPQD